VTLNLSGLDNFVMMPSIASGTKIQGISIGNTATGTAASRFLLCGQIEHYSQGAIYLAKTNIIVLGNDMEIGAMSTYSNSLPCPVYLGISNSVLVGNNGAANGLVTAGSRGNTNAFLVFNPAFLGGATPPVASFASPPAINGGRVTTFYVCRSDGGVIPAYGYANFTGGNVSIMASTMLLGYAGTNTLNALGVLTLDNGIVNVNYLTNGDQTVSAGGARPNRAQADAARIKAKPTMSVEVGRSPNTNTEAMTPITGLPSTPSDAVMAGSRRMMVNHRP